jgi:hypothetical protein
MNPELTDSERSAFLPDPKPTTWRKLTLEMMKSDGKRLDITFLRPPSWIGESQADIDATIYLDLPEMGENINAEWNTFRNNNQNSTASDVMKFTLEIDKKYGYAMYWLR